MLTGVRVLERTVGIAGGYCGKLLADAGADVVKVEPADGDPLRSSGSGALFEFLNESKTLAPHAENAAADVLLVDRAAEPVTPSQVVVCITPFGLDGPWTGRPATEFTLQAAAGSTGHRGLPEHEPLAAGGRLGEWLTGTYAAVAAIAALLRVGLDGRGELIDVAALDCMAATMTLLPSVFASFLGWPPTTGTGRTIEVPSVEPTIDGYVVYTTNSAQQYADFCMMIGRPDLLDDPALARPLVRFARRAEFEAVVHDYTTKRTTSEALEDAALFRIPCGPVLNGETILEFEHFVERGVFVPSRSGRFVEPRIPYRTSVPSRPQRMLGGNGRQSARSHPEFETSLPLSGLRVIDCTAWWAGPAATEALACLGADVIKVESISRPDLMRYAATKPPSTDEWWEWGPIFHAANAGKRGITLDLTRPEGITVFERLLTTADVLVENYTPRVMEQFGLGWDRVHEINPDLVMVRMPAFGLDGPWREHTGFAQTMECIAGMAWLTGLTDGPPVLVRGACDPLAGMHAVIGTLVALYDRAANGGGRLVEAVMVEAALNASAEQIVEFSSNGTVLGRSGNRWSGAAPQGVYPSAGDDTWIAIAVDDDDQWRSLRNALGSPAWANRPRLETLAGRLDAQDEIDAHISSWTRERDAAELADELVATGVPAAEVIRAREVVHNPQLRHRGLFETKHHRVTGDHELPALPFRFRSVSSWLAGPAPTLGEHNDIVLTELGLRPDEIDALRTAGIIGERPTGL